MFLWLPSVFSNVLLLKKISKLFVLFIILILQFNCIELVNCSVDEEINLNDEQLTATRTRTTTSINNDNNDNEEPSDYEIWIAIKNSLEEWRRKHQQRQLLLSSLNNNSNDNNNNGTTKKIRKRSDELESVCYESIGCFRHKGPFDYLNTLPASPELIATTFTLYTRRNPLEGESLYLINNNNASINGNGPGGLNVSDNASLTSSASISSASSAVATASITSTYFNSSNQIKIIIHGFGSSSKRPWVMKMTEGLLELDDFNVINVDWQNGSKLPNYVQAAANTQLIGKQIAKLIRNIEQTYHVPPSNYHLIGFSLGAHVAGFTGQEISNISRITGLDPAAPLFEGYPTNVRLDPSDAQFVDVIHSNGDGFIRGGLGSYEPMGSVDFYPNGGRVQVGCSSALGVLTNIFYHGQWNLLCNHRRAFHFFIDSLHQDCTFRAFSCPSYEEYVRGKCFDCGQDGRKCSNMGYYSDQSLGRGAMYLVTRDKEPFCVNQFRVQIQFSLHQGSTWGNIQLQLINGDGLNETFPLTQDIGQLKEGERLQALIVAHPKLINITQINLIYTRYKGWIYNGQNEWNIDRIELLDSNFVIKTYCGTFTSLPHTIPIGLKLMSNNCSMNYDDYYYEDYNNNEQDFDQNSIISNAILQPELVTPSIIDGSIITSTSIIPTVATTSLQQQQQYYSNQQQNYYNSQPFYGYMISPPELGPHFHGPHHSHLMRKSQLSGTGAASDLSNYQSSSTTIQPKTESESELKKIERQTNFNKNDFQKMERALRITPSTSLNKNQWEASKRSHHLIRSSHHHHQKMQASVNDPNEFKLKSITTEVQQQQQQNFMAPIINGASKIFWKFWNNLNTDYYSNSNSNNPVNNSIVKFTPLSLSSASNSIDQNSNSIVGEESKLSLSIAPSTSTSTSTSALSVGSTATTTTKTTTALQPIYLSPIIHLVDRIFVLSNGKDQIDLDSNPNNNDDHGGSNNDRKDSTHFVLYSLIPITKSQSSSLIPVKTSSSSSLASSSSMYFKLNNNLNHKKP